MMALKGLVNFFERLTIKDEPPTKSHPVDELLLSKILLEANPKYVNLETGRLILSSSAFKKKYINQEFCYCGDDSEQFMRISDLIKARTKENKPEEKPRTKKTEKVKRYIPTTQRRVKKEDKPRRKAFPKTLKHYLWIRDYGNVAEAKCLCCGLNSVFEAITEIGHIVAFSKGGSDEADNLRLICRTCNADMGDQNMDEFMREHNFPVMPTHNFPVIS